LNQPWGKPVSHFFIGLEAFQYSAPFDPSMMVNFHKRLPESVVDDCNERIVRHGLNVIRSAESPDVKDGDHDNGSAAVEISKRSLSMHRSTKAHC
jgi:IS5 family transposase